MKNCLSISSSTLICSLSFNVTGHTQNSGIWLKFWYWPDHQTLRVSKSQKFSKLVVWNWSKLIIQNWVIFLMLRASLFTFYQPFYPFIQSYGQIFDSYVFFIWSSGFGLLTQLEQVWKHCDKSIFRYFFKDNIIKDLLY